MLLEIENIEEVDTFMDTARRNGHDVVSIKGKPPEGANYSDGEPITKFINTKWVNCDTGDMVEIKYKKG